MTAPDPSSTSYRKHPKMSGLYGYHDITKRDEQIPSNGSAAGVSLAGVAAEHACCEGYGGRDRTCVVKNIDSSDILYPGHVKILRNGAGNRNTVAVRVWSMTESGPTIQIRSRAGSGLHIQAWSSRYFPATVAMLAVSAVTIPAMVTTRPT